MSEETLELWGYCEHGEIGPHLLPNPSGDKARWKWGACPGRTVTLRHEDDWPVVDTDEGPKWYEIVEEATDD